MRLVTFKHKNDVKIGALQGESVIELNEVAPDMITLISKGSRGLEHAQRVLREATVSIPINDISLLAPIPHPVRNIMCLGLNYAEHAEESLRAEGRQAEIPELPVVFTKATTSVIGPYDPIPFDPQVSSAIDWEVELAFIIGQRGKNIPAQEAMDYVFGYTVLNDVSARDLQKRGKQFFKGKSLDGACPMGPWIQTADDAPDITSLRITTRVNGEIKQDGNTSHMIFDIPAIVAYLSRGMTLLEGDIVSTGTPSGVGFARIPPEFLRPGDVVECEVEGIGTIRNAVIATDS